MVLTGTNRSRPTSISRESGNTSTAAPIAVSTWITFGVVGSLGSTVFSLRISGRPRMPSRTSRASFIARRSNQRLLVEQNRCRSRSARASRSLGGVCAVSRSTIRPSRLAAREVAALAVARRTADRLDRERCAAGGEPARDPGVGYGAEVVGVRHEGPLVARVEEAFEEAGAAQRGVEVAVAGRAPLQVRVLRPADRCEVLGQELGLLVLEELQRQPLDRKVLVARDGGHGVARGVEAVHEQQRQRGVVLLAEVEHLPGDDVEEGEAAAHAQQRLRAVHAHRGAEAAVQLDHGGRADRGTRRRRHSPRRRGAPPCRPARSRTRGSSRSRRAPAAGSSARTSRWRLRPPRRRPSCRGPC